MILDARAANLLLVKIGRWQGLDPVPFQLSQNWIDSQPVTGNVAQNYQISLSVSLQPRQVPIRDVNVGNSVHPVLVIGPCNIITPVRVRSMGHCESSKLVPRGSEPHLDPGLRLLVFGEVANSRDQITHRVFFSQTLGLSQQNSPPDLVARAVNREEGQPKLPGRA